MRRVERIIGVLFLLSTGAFLIGSGMLDSIFHRSDLLLSVESNRASLIAGMLLELINAIAVVGIAILLQPILRKHHEAFALGYFASRVMESVLLIVSLLGPLILLALSTETYSDALLETIGSLTVQVHFMLFNMAMLVLSLGSLLFCYILYRSRLVPRWLSVIGLIGYTGLLTSSSLSFVGLDAGSILYIPGAVFEIVLPIWLILKGFNLQKKET